MCVAFLHPELSASTF
jgi:hypothetical protein